MGTHPIFESDFDCLTENMRLATILPLAILNESYADFENKIKLSEVEALTLYKGKLTNGRRLDGVQQLTCHGSACDSFQPEVVRCYNRGTDGMEIQWECRAEMPDNIRFGKVQVTCEGYDHSKDEFVLNGSCGLEYTLKDISGENDCASAKFWTFVIGLGLGILIGIGIGKSDESGGSANSRSSETRAEQPPSYSETVHTEPTIRQRHAKNDESETSTTWSTSTGFGGTSNR